MSAKNLKYDNNRFDCIIDKACFDACITGENFQENAEMYLSEVYRCLAPGGAYISISYGHPEKRLVFFDEDVEGSDGQRKKYDWNVFTHKIPKM